MANFDAIGVVTEVFLAVGPALKLATIALAVVVSPAALPLDDLTSWESGEPIVLAAFVLLATGGAVFQYSLPVPERVVRERSAGDQCTFCARLPSRSGLIFVNLKLLCGRLLSLPFCCAQPDQRRVSRSKRLLRQWAVISAARAATRAANGATFMAQTVIGWGSGLAAWRHREYHRHYRTLTQGTKLFYLLFALLIASIPSPEGGGHTLTPSQSMVSPFMTPEMHAAHVVELHEQFVGEQRQAAKCRLLSLGPAGFDAMLAWRPPPLINVTLDFSVLASDTPAMVLEGVPANETIQSLATAIAQMVGIPEWEVGLMSMENVTVNPRRALSHFATDSRVELRIIPRNRVGGDSMDVGDSSAIPPHPGRRRIHPQPATVKRPNRHHGTQWWCKAIVEQEGTGKAIGTWTKKYQEFQGPTEEDVLRQREEWLHSFIHVKQRAAPTGKRFAPTLEREPRSKRAAAPSNLQLERRDGPSSDQARAGPGRGRTFEAAAASKSSITEAILEEPIEILAAKSSNWLAQASQRKQWQTDRIQQLEAQLAASLQRERQKDAVIARQEETIAQLRQRVAELEQLELALAEQLLAFVPTNNPLQQASHAKALLEDPKWTAVLGVGYRDDQKRSLVYQHVSKLMDRTHQITGGDPQKAKYLVDLM